MNLRCASLCVTAKGNDYPYLRQADRNHSVRSACSAQNVNRRSMHVFSRRQWMWHGLVSWVSAWAMLCPLESSTWAEVRSAKPDGFSIAIKVESPLEADATFRALVDDFAKWYDASHSYSGKAENLSLDLKRHCMFEKLPNGGFVRHMEIAYYHPNQRVIRLLGGLGPLQEMGVTGALTFAVKPAEGGGASTMLTYRITGADDQELNKIAPIVDQVLEGQMGRFEKYCASHETSK
ncbi:MAG: hypothetical protein ACE361_15460 [Aureliella sp.]